MDGSAIRNQIVEEHAELKEWVGEIEALARHFELSVGKTPAIGKQLRILGLKLYKNFGAHLESEEKLLEPALRRAGPEGEQLARQLQLDHLELRELLKYLIDRLEQQPYPTILIARQLQQFADYLRLEIDREETTMLTPAILEGASG